MIPAMPDNGMWVETDGFGRCRIDGNAHTFPGRISAWSEEVGKWVTIDRRDIRDAPQEVWTWIDGFLSGSEPEFHEFLGVHAVEVDVWPTEHEDWGRYQDTLEEFRKTGAFPFPLNAMPRKPPPAGLTSEPWALAAGQVWRWNGSDWRPQDPQPAFGEGLMMSGSICDERGHHLMHEGDDNYSACSGCGLLAVLTLD